MKKRITGTESDEELRESEKRYRLLAENAADVIWTVDMNMQPTYISPSFTRLLGFSVEEAMKFRMETIFTNVSFKTVLKMLTEELSIEKMQQKDLSRSRTLELELNHRDGSTVPVEIKYTFVRDTHEQPVEILAIARDITERKQAEERFKQSCERLQLAMNGTIKVMSSIVELRDPYTAGHQFRVTKLACAIAEEMSLPNELIDGLRAAGLVHDIGKIHVPAEILSKPGKLSDVEFTMIKDHPKVGYDILKQIEFMWPVAEIVLQHHERMNGTGYPSGLSGEHLVLEARILAVADVIEATSSHRPYRAGLGMSKALKEISGGKGILYDSKVVEACLALFHNKGFNF